MTALDAIWYGVIAGSLAVLVGVALQWWRQRPAMKRVVVPVIAIDADAEREVAAMAQRKHARKLNAAAEQATAKSLRANHVQLGPQPADPWDDDEPTTYRAPGGKQS